MTTGRSAVSSPTQLRGAQVAGAYAIGVGASILGTWAVLYHSGDIPELATAPLEIGYHLLAEGLTAGVLLAAGMGLWYGRAWAGRLLPVALGILLYTVVNSTGYYANLGEWPMVGLFTALTVLTGLLLVAFLRGGITPDRRPAESNHGGEFRA